MTTEQKARAYDEAIKKIKYVMGHGVSPVLNKEDLQDIFPELRESEDEKIRKNIIHLVNMSYENGYFAFKKWEQEKMLAWLEKQASKQKWTEEDEQPMPKFKVGDKVYALRNRFECAIESIDGTTYYGDTTNFDIKDQDDWELVEQKHTKWSEEDEDNFKDIISAIHSVAYKTTKDEEAKIEFLNSLKKRLKE